VSVGELTDAVDIVTVNNGASAGETKILKGVVSFSAKNARQIMQSRMDIMAVEVGMDFHEVMDKVNKYGYSRIPVYEDTLDKLKGILYIKELLPHIDKEEDFPWQLLVRKEVFYVPEGKKIDELFKDFQERRVHIAIVADEYGGTSGLVTMEDIMEEIIGDINDEFDDSVETLYSKRSENEYVFDGKISLNDFCKVVDVSPDTFEEVKGESESLGGLMLEMSNKIPVHGQELSFPPFDFKIVAVNKKRVKSVRVCIRKENKVSEVSEKDSSGD
jgi:gliding motility-associated protein GldE